MLEFAWTISALTEAQTSVSPSPSTPEMRAATEDATDEEATESSSSMTTSLACEAALPSERRESCPYVSSACEVNADISRPESLSLRRRPHPSTFVEACSLPSRL